MRSKVIVALMVLWFACVLLAIFAGMTRTMVGLVVGVGLFGMAFFSEDTFTVVIGVYVLLFSACLFALAFFVGGFSVPKFVEMLTRGGDPPYLLSIASSAGVWGFLVVIYSALRRRWK